MPKKRKALSPVVSIIILVAVVIAVSIASATWMGSLSFTFMKVEELQVTNHTWASDLSYIDLTVKNVRAELVTIGEVRVNNELASSVIYTSGSATLSGGDSATLRVAHNFASGTKYEFWVVTTTGNKYPYMTTAIPAVEPEEIEATVDVDPDTLNLKSKGKWVTCYIELPEDYDVSDIDTSTVKLNYEDFDEISAELHPTEVGDHDTDGIPDLMVKFDRQDLIAILSVGKAILTITGEVNDVSFEGTDTIIVIDG